jgi:hypothetical protein
MEAFLQLSITQTSHLHPWIPDQVGNDREKRGEKIKRGK